MVISEKKIKDQPVQENIFCCGLRSLQVLMSHAKSAKGLFPILILLFLIVPWISTAKDMIKTGNCSRCRGWSFLA